MWKIYLQAAGTNEGISNGVFPSEWKKGNVEFLFTRKTAMFRKCQERLIFNELFPFFIKNSLSFAK